MPMSTRAGGALTPSLTWWRDTPCPQFSQHFLLLVAAIAIDHRGKLSQSAARKLVNRLFIIYEAKARQAGHGRHCQTAGCFQNHGPLRDPQYGAAERPDPQAGAEDGGGQGLSSGWFGPELPAAAQ